MAKSTSFSSLARAARNKSGLTALSGGAHRLVCGWGKVGLAVVYLIRGVLSLYFESVELAVLRGRGEGQAVLVAD